MPVTLVPVAISTPRPGAGGEGHRQVRRVELAIGREEHRAEDAGRIEQPVEQLERPPRSTTSSSGSPNVAAQPAWRRSSSSRVGCGREAQRTDLAPAGVVTGLGVPRRRYRSVPYIIIRVSVTELRSWPTSPAEWNVDPT